MKRVAIYVRVSTDEQKKHGLSVDNQIDALASFCKENNYHISDIYNDAGISGRKSYKKRPALLKLIQDCKDGKIDLIVFTKLDRWFRSVADYYEVQSVLDSCNVPWKCLWEDYDTETSSGVFKVNIMLSVAQSEADRTAERIKATNAYKLSKGEYVGGTKAPLGYKRNGKQYVINEEEYEGVNAFFQTYLSTLSQKKAREAALMHGLNMSIYQSQRTLYHPAHYGALPFVVGTYITPEQHELIQNAKKTTKYYTNERRYIFSGLCRCKYCGNNMVVSTTTHYNKNGSVHETIRYVCKKHEKKAGCPEGSSIHEKVLENYLINTIADKLEEYNAGIKYLDSTVDEKAIRQLNARLKRLRDLYEYGDIDFAEYKSKRIEITDKISALQNIPVKTRKKLPDDWLDMYQKLDIEHKRAFWFNIIDYIIINGMRCTEPSIIF